MRIPSLLVVALIAAGAHAQTASSSGSVNADQTTSTAANASSATVAQAGSASASAASATNLSAELSKKVDSKHAKVGDEVEARTTSAARLSDGTKLPKGTRLMGKVTDVQAKSAAQKESRLAFTFDRAVMHDGSAIPIRAMVMSLAAPAAMSASAQGSDDMSAGAGPAPVMAGGGGRASGGGLVGGGAVSQAGGTLRGASSAVGNAAGGVAASANNTLSTTANTGATNLQVANQISGSVANMPGVNFGSGGSANESAVLNANGKDIALASGTQMTMSVSANR